MKTINMNDTVRVKLTDLGRQIHKEKHGEVCTRANVSYQPPQEDEDGYSKWQLWHLMSFFGEHLSLGLEIPFEPRIVLDTVKETT
jgi:hypothetical protein